jgi:hypothetical protein
MPRDLAKGVLYVAPSPSRRSAASPSLKASPDRPNFRLAPARESRSILRSVLLLLPLLTVLPYYCKNLHYDLPTPVTNGYVSRQVDRFPDLYLMFCYLLGACFDDSSSPIGSPPVLSELNIIHHVQTLEDIGYRIIGTDEAVLGEQYVYDVMEGLAESCAKSTVLECDLWMQVGDGMHQ